MGDNVDPGDGGGDHLDQKTDTLATNDEDEVTASHEESNAEQEKVRLTVYKKTLLRWLRWRLEGVEEGAGAVTDISFDLRDGVLLLKLLANLTDTQIPVEKGEFRVQRLGNLSCALEVMQRERARTEELNINLILEGDLNNTLNLIWNIIVRWELQPRFSRLEWQPFSIDQILLSWLNTLNTRPPVTHLQQHLQDGLVVCRLVLSSQPNLPGLQDALHQTGEERWSTLLRVASKYLDTPPLLDAEDLAQGVVDKNSLLCYLGILFSSMPQDHLTPDLIHTLNIAPDPTLGAKISGSPVKSQARKADEELSLEGWTSCLEEVLSWILEAEEHLLSLHNLGHRQLHTVKTKFYNHEDFMLELQNHQGAVGKVLSQGRELVTKLGRAQDQVEVRLQMKVLIDRWEKVRELAMSKQSELHQLIMRLQLEQISSLRSWITAAEDRISRLGLTGETKEKVGEDVVEVERLQGDLEDQHAAVTAISNFILVESDEATNIEDELTGLGERWCMICRCIEERLNLLQTVQGVLQEQERLNAYLQGVETMLKEMEMSQEVDIPHLQEQTNRIMVLEEELEVERGKLTQLGVNTENIQVRSLENDPGVMKLCNEMETLQDRWDVLIEILFAQKHRISKLSSDLNHSKDETTSAAKRRKLTASHREHFHTSYSRILSWSETIRSRLEEALLASLPLQDQTLLLEETQAEVDAQQETINQLVALGDQLRQEIVGSDLVTVLQQVDDVKQQNSSIKETISQLRTHIDYQVEKDCFYKLSGELAKIFENFTTFTVEGLRLVEVGRGGEVRDRATDKRSVLASVAAKLEQIKGIGANLALNTDEDPGRSIKKDLFQLCQSFESVELQFSNLLSKLDAPADTEPSSPSNAQLSSPKGDHEGKTKELSNSEAEESKHQPRGESDTSSEEQKNCRSDRSEPAVSSRTENLSSDPSASSECIVSDDPTPPGRTEGKSVSGGRSKVDEVESISWESKVEVRSEHDEIPPICDRLSDRVPVENPSAADRNVIVSEASLDLTSKDESFGHYEECSVSSTITFVRPKVEVSATKVEKVEAFITMPSTSEQNCLEPRREVSQLEKNLGRCEDLLNTALYLQDSSTLEDDLRSIQQHLALLADAFVPANLTEDESSVVLDQLLEVKSGLREREKAVKGMLEDLSQMNEEISGLSLWMKEVRMFLEAEDAALGDLDTLDAQLKESNALQDDIETLEPNLANIREMGAELLQRSNPESDFYPELKSQIERIQETWQSTVAAARKQNNKLKTAFEKSREVLDLMNEINKFLDQLESDLPREGVVTEAPELSQRTYKLLQLRDRTDRKSCILERLSATVSELLEAEAGEGGDGDAKASTLGTRLSEVQSRWSTLTTPVNEQYSKMREATTDYGEFKTLVAQESDWLDRLEKKLRRSSKCAADAEEISEELDDLENCLHNHPADRLQRLKYLGGSLSEKDVLISPVQTETGRLAKRWETLERQAKERIRSLEECITEAQEWECKILAVQDWLTEKDVLLTSHLEHELTIDDLPDETQKERMLREFEDKENILADMDQQVDAYRSVGKEEAATRLEDQLTLIHTKFQELSGKFEVFQQPTDYDGRLERISRQLRDIQHNMYLTELISHEPDSIHGQLHHTRCIYNALADIKPDVEATIKMGRKLVEAGAVADNILTTNKIDQLKELFNVLGAQVTEARETLQKALEISEVLLGKLNYVNLWLQQTEKELETLGSDVLSDRVKEMKDMKKEVREVLSLKQEFVSLCADPTLLGGLKESLTGLESAWSRVQDGLAKRLPENEKVGVQELDLSGEDEYRFTSPANTSLNSSLGEEGVVLQEFRAAFQEISSWLDTAEQQLERTRRESEDRQLGEQILGLQPKVQSLGAMAVEIVEKFNSQRPDVEPEMVILGQRWENIVKKIESSSNFSLVEVEHIKTTIAHLVVPPPDPMTTSLTSSVHSEPEEISTLPEEPQAKGSRRSRDVDSSRDSSPEFFSASPLTPERNGSGSKDTIYTESPLRTTKKTPPPTKPKPRWYIESLQDSGSLPSTPGSTASVPPVQQVIVTASTLPSPRSLPSSALPSPRSISSSGVSSPRSLPSTNTIIEPQRKNTPVPIISPMRTILPSVDTSPSTSPVQSPVVVAPQSVLDDIDKQNERDNAIIDKLLRGTSEDIEDVKARKAYSSSRFQSTRENTANHAKEIKEFDEKFTNISLKIATARQRFENLDLETDCGLRNDLIDMELQELEAEVATTISRGDTLVLMVHRFNADQGDDLKERVSQLRESWANLRKNAEEKKAEFVKESETLDILKEKLEKMKDWLVISIKLVRQKKTEEEIVFFARKEIDRKMNEMKAIEKLISSLKSFDRLGSMKENTVFVRSQWGILKDLATPLRKSKSKSPRETVDKSVPAEIFSRITKMQEAISALRNQLDTSILHGKQYENMNLQAEVLERMKAALETLRPKVKKTMSDIDVVSGALSMEYFDKLTALGERLRRDWKEINEDYVDRERTWRECSSELGRFSARAETLSSWISGKEKTILRWKQERERNENHLSSDQVSTLRSEIKEAEKEVTELTETGRRICSGSGAAQARDIFNQYDKLLKRWRSLYTESSLCQVDVNSNGVERDTKSKSRSPEKGNLNEIVTWSEAAVAAAGKVYNASELEELKQGIKAVQALQSSLVQQRQGLEQLAGQIGENSTVYQNSRVRIEKVAIILPKRLSYLVEKSDKLVKMVEDIEENQKWIENVEQRYTTSRTQEDHISVRIALSEKEYSINKLFNEYLLLEREVTSSGQSVNTHLCSEVKQLKSKWLTLSSDVRRINPVTLSCPVPTMAAEIPKTNSSQSVSSFVSLASLASPTSQSSEQWAAASPTTASTSPMSEEVESIPSSDPPAQKFSEKGRSLLAWLASMSRDSASKGLNVVDTDRVGQELDRFRSLISQLESRRSERDQLVQAGGELSTEEAKSLCAEVERGWSSLQQALMARKTELTSMLEHADNLNTKGAEVSKWLGKLEKMLTGAGVGKTRDILLRQIREVNQINRELEQYGHHVTLLSQVCNRLISIYTSDNTAGISRTNQQLTGRYSALSSSCTARGKSLNAALQALNTFDKELAEFLVWLGEAEASLERMESRESKVKVDDVTKEIRERDEGFRGLLSRGREQQGFSGESDIVLNSKMEELNRRWTGLQNSVLNLSARTGRLDDQLKQELSDLRSWVRAKVLEVQALKVGKNFGEIHRQSEEHRSFREKVKQKEKEFDSIRSKTSSMEEGLEKEWKNLEALSASWEKDLLEAERTARIVEDSLDEAERKLRYLESSSGEWELPPSLDTADAERDEVESTISSLKSVEELVLTAKVETDAKPFLDVTERLASVERRLTDLKEAAVARREQLSGLVVQENPANQEFLKECVPEGWERCLTNDNIPYYSRHADETTSWDHPTFVDLLQTLTAMNTVKYCAYRLALKLRKVQQKLCLDLLDIESAVVCFDAHGLSADKHDLTIAAPEIVTILTSIYETLYQCEPEDINVPLCVDLCLNWILNVFDIQRTGVVRVLSFKLGLVLLCRGPLNEKYEVLFNLASGSVEDSGLLDQRRLGLLLYDCMQIPKYLGEIALFGGSNIEPSVRSCLQKGSRNLVNLVQFLEWLREEPQSLVWLPVLHRLASAETATHDVRCKICRVDPIVGFRYHCRKCFNLDICHACFFLGKSIKGHKPEHPMQEYCTSTNRTDNARHLLQAFRNSFRSRKYFKKKQKKLGYLPVQSIVEGDNFESPALSPNLSLESREFPGSTTESISSKLAQETSCSLDSRVEEDEHSLIASYCRMLSSGSKHNNNNNNNPSTATILRDVDLRLDNMEKEAVEQLLQQLQEENSRLECEYKELVTEGRSSSNQEAKQEEKTLRQQKIRLEARMAILEDHNRQLEAQLDRLRQLVSTDAPVAAAGSAPQEDTKIVVSAQLHAGEGRDPAAAPPVHRRQPPTALDLRRVHEVDHRDSGTSGTTDQSNRNSATSGSLNLSQHNTENQDD